MWDELGKGIKVRMIDPDVLKLEQIPQPGWPQFLRAFFFSHRNRLPRCPELQEKGLRLVNRLVTTCERDVPWIEGQVSKEECDRKNTCWF